MKIYNKDKTQELKEYDLSKGILKNDILIKHLPKIKKVEEQGHYETIKEYANGGKDVEWIVDVKGVEAQEEKDIKEEIMIYVPYTPKELEQNQAKLETQKLKQYLQETDYVIIKMLEEKLMGKNITQDLKKYVSILNERIKARNKINELEKIIKGGEINA